MYQVYGALRWPEPNTGGSRDLSSQQGSVSDPAPLGFEGCPKIGLPEERRFGCSTDSGSQATLNEECPGKQRGNGKKIYIYTQST